MTTASSLLHPAAHDGHLLGRPKGTRPLRNAIIQKKTTQASYQLDALVVSSCITIQGWLAFQGQHFKSNFRALPVFIAVRESSTWTTEISSSVPLIWYNEGGLAFCCCTFLNPDSTPPSRILYLLPNNRLKPNDSLPCG